MMKLPVAMCIIGLNFAGISTDHRPMQIPQGPPGSAFGEDLCVWCKLRQVDFLGK